MLRPRFETMRSLITSFSFALVVAAALSGCTKDDGGPCQVDGDCSSGLVCSRGIRAERGTCKTPAAAAADAGGQQQTGCMDIPLAGEDAGPCESAGHDAG
jgi:hypothetical protein